MEAIEENYQYVLDNLIKLKSEYLNKYVVVSNKKVLNSFDTYDSAAQFGLTNCGINSGFLVYEVTDSEVVNFVMLAEL